MIRFDRSQQWLAAAISALAGFVDAIGFVESGGFFVSFMTGNSTRLAVGVAEWSHAGLVAGAIILLFVAGVVAGSLAAARAARQRSGVILLFVAALLAAAGGLRLADQVVAAVACLAVAMGMVNAAVEGRGGAVVGVTYMTGTLVQMGQKMANALRGSGDGRWLPHLALWSALVVGAIVGARVTIGSPLAAYALATVGAAALGGRAIWAMRRA
ncbi:YoaK family protein [Sphingopyxis alaskensis]|uniref:YoaK family protein n=1 Tax=Sphingopyxis alaskensis TaxID=117207 RepID=UPI0039196A29